MTVRCSLAVAFILSFLLTPITRAGEEAPAAGLTVSADFPGGFAGHKLFSEGSRDHLRVCPCPALHLDVSVRAPRARRISEWVNGALSGLRSAGPPALQATGQ